MTVSLDSLDPATFGKLTDSSTSIGRVLEGIGAARDAGLGPIKINSVIRRGINDGEIMDLVRFARENGVVLRFIEYMDVGTTNRWRLEEVVPTAELVEMIDAEFPIEPVADSDGVARSWKFRDGGGTIGFVSSVSKPFCSDCVRARISADGRLYTCLFASEGHDLRTLVRSGLDDAGISERIAAIWTGRTDRYSELRGEATGGANRIEMSRIGG